MGIRQQLEAAHAQPLLWLPTRRRGAGAMRLNRTEQRSRKGSSSLPPYHNYSAQPQAGTQWRAGQGPTISSHAVQRQGQWAPRLYTCRAVSCKVSWAGDAARSAPGVAAHYPHTKQRYPGRRTASAIKHRCKCLLLITAAGTIFSVGRWPHLHLPAAVQPLMRHPARPTLQCRSCCQVHSVPATARQHNGAWSDSW